MTTCTHFPALLANGTSINWARKVPRALFTVRQRQNKTEYISIYQAVSSQKLLIVLKTNMALGHVGLGLSMTNETIK